MPELRRGGVETVFFRLAAGFLAAGYTVDLLVANATGPLRLEIPPGVRLVDLQRGRILATLTPLVRYLRAERPTLLVSGQDHANVIAILGRALARHRLAVVVTAHSPLMSNAEGRSGCAGKLLPLAVRWTYPWAEAVVAVSPNVAVDLLTKAPRLRGSITTIPNPTVPPDLTALSQAPSGNHWLDHPDGTPTLLAVGRLDEVKDYPTLLAAFAQVRASRATRLVIVGEGKQREDLERLARKLKIDDALCLTGDVANPFPFYARAQLTCISSLSEAGPMVLIESVASGVPVVSTSCSTLVQSILGDGKFGAIVPVGDATAMALAINECLRDPIYFDLSTATIKQFWTETAVASYLRLFESISVTNRDAP